MRDVFGGRLPDLFLSPGQCFSLHLSEEEQAIWEQYMHTLNRLVHMEGVDRDTVSSFFLSSLHFTHSLYKSKVAVRWKYKSRNRQTVERFVRLVNDYAKTEHEIEFYASQLCMTAHYLGMVVKKETGITAKEWIDKTLVILIQLELRYTSKSLKMIANEFGFVSLRLFAPSLFKSAPFFFPTPPQGPTRLVWPPQDRYRFYWCFCYLCAGFVWRVGLAFLLFGPA